MKHREQHLGYRGRTKPADGGAAKRGSLGWWHGLVSVVVVGWLCSCVRTPTAELANASSHANSPLAASDAAPPPPLQWTRTTTQPSAPRITPEAADNAHVTTIDPNPLSAWPNSVGPQTIASGPTNASVALPIVAYEKILLDRVSPTALRLQAIAGLINAPALQVDMLSDAVLIAIVLDTLHHSDRIRDASRRFIIKFASARVARAYEAVLADLQANTSSDRQDSHHRDWLACMGLEMYYQYGERQLQHMVKPTAEGQMKLAQAITSFQQAWALRTLASADKQYLFPKALYGWAHALEDRAWIEQDARGIPNMQYTQMAQVKYQEFLTEARRYKDQSHDYQYRAHLYHAESHQEQPTQRASLKALAWRVLSLTGSFETGMDEPNNFAELAGNFDGQGISFGTLQWNIGQLTLQKLLAEINRQRGTLIQRVFGPNYETLIDMLGQSKTQQLAWAKSIQTNKFILHEPWRKAFETLGIRYEFQKIQVEHASHLFQTALKLCEQFQVRSERAVALMFDILVQNGGVQDAVQAKIFSDFKALHTTGNAEQDEVARLLMIGNRVAEAAQATWVADVRSRKLTIANGAGEVHGKQYNLADRDISLNDYETRKPLGANPTISPLVNQVGLQSQL
jgi:hypothetical protein